MQCSGGRYRRQNLFVFGMIILLTQIGLAQTEQRGAADITAQVSPPRYLPDTYYSNPLTDSLWVSPTQLIKLPQAYSFGSNATILAVMDTETGKETPLDKINAVIRETWGIAADGHMHVDAGGRPLGMPFNPYATRLSPDSRWLLWPSRTLGRPTWVAMTLDGSEFREWPRHTGDDGSEGGAGWMRDSNHWVEVSDPQGHRQFCVWVYSLDTPDGQEYPLEPPSPGFMLPPFPNSKVLFTGDGRGWIMGAFGNRYEIVPGPRLWTLRKAPILTKIAQTSSTCDAALSPSGDWLVWRETDATTKQSQLRIGRPDGSEAQTIFETTGPLLTGTPYIPQWTPDERKIVFHWSGYSEIANTPNGEGLYTISLSQVHLPSTANRLARLGQRRGLFPIAAGQNWRTRLVEDTPH